MNKKDFLEILRQALSHEVSEEIIEQNVRYYDQYISSHKPSDEERIINELGSPRLIAKTIIEKEKAAMNKEGYSDKDQNASYSRAANDEDHMGRAGGRRNSMFVFTDMKWYHKLLFWLVALLVILVIIFLFRFILGFLFTLGIPILFILLIFYLVRRR